jgi:hypothetical protein
MSFIVFRNAIEEGSRSKAMSFQFYFKRHFDDSTVTKSREQESKRA